MPSKPKIPVETEGQTELKQSTPQGLETYNTIAETIGGLPSLRVKDNVIQAAVIAGVTCIAVIVGSAIGGIGGAIMAAILGLLLSTIISGVVLMILGWIRAAKKTKV
jgi:VIT1/CCC1 family predicted Fe2+/Mn2+ transporter